MQETQYTTKNQEIGARVRELRKRLGLSQSDFGAPLGMSITGVSSWESGAGIPQARIYQICAIYNVSRLWLETGAGDPSAVVTPDNIEESARRVAIYYAKTLLEKLPESMQENILAVLRGIVEAKRTNDHAQND